MPSATSCNMRNAIRGCGSALLSSWFCGVTSNRKLALAVPPPVCLWFSKQSLQVGGRVEAKANSVSSTRALRAAVLRAGQSVSWAPPAASLFGSRCTVPRSMIQPPLGVSSPFVRALTLRSLSWLVLFVCRVILSPCQIPSPSFLQRANPSVNRTTNGGLRLLAWSNVVPPLVAGYLKR